MSATLASAALAWSAPATACEPTIATSDVAGLPPAWRDAIEALVIATTREGHPWSCTGARVALRLEGPDGPAHLTVVQKDGLALERAIAAPADVVPVGEALLARPLESPSIPAPPERVVVPVSLPSRIERGAEQVPHARTEPRLLIDVLGSTRYTGSPAAVWMGGAMRAVLPFDAWSLGFWGRFEVATVELQPVPVDFWMYSGSVGASVGRRILARPLELTAAFEPSVAIVSMDGGADGTPQSADAAKADLRLGARLQGAIPFGTVWRGLFALDGEIGPMALASARHRLLDPRLPPLPTFTLGASLGGELALR